METLNNRWLLLAFRLVLATIFLAAGISKLFHPAEFVSLVVSYHLLPVWLAQVYGYLLPCVELITGILLVLGLFPRWAAAISLNYNTYPLKSARSSRLPEKIGGIDNYAILKYHMII